MQQFHCRCGQIVYCENSLCERCGRTLAFEPLTGELLSLDLQRDGVLTDEQGKAYRLCGNRAAYRACNGVVESTLDNSGKALCGCCRLNRTIPVIEGRPENIPRWKRLENAKRRMIAGVCKLGLSVDADGNSPMRFDFMEDKRSHPDVLEHFVTTGHKDGVITINVTEADDIQRVQQRELMGERYRTVLGHFRHEAGHYYYGQLARDPGAFASMFGEPTTDYESSLQSYYQQGPQAGWEERFVSAYASSHPLEDWAECFAHYTHIRDTLETAVVQGLAEDPGEGVRATLDAWMRFSVKLNEVSRSLGLRDVYPFLLTPVIIDKLEFVDAAIAEAALNH